MRPGPKNLITDVAGLRVGNAEDHALRSGVTVVLCEEPAVAAVQVLGGAPGTRETDLLAPHNTVQTVDAVVLSGGSAFGLDAASGVQAGLREAGRGFAVGPYRVPIVPAAILFDLMNGGEKDWGRYPPYRELAYEACETAGDTFALGTAGGGYGATTADLKGGLGSASVVTSAGHTVGAIVVVKRGPHGAIAIDAEGRFSSTAAPAVSVVDTIGAGDVFNAAFLAAYAGGRGLEASLAAGTTVASTAISTHPRRYVPTAEKGPA